MPKKPQDEYHKLPSSVRKIIERRRLGQTLCKQFTGTCEGGSEVEYFLLPSGKKIGPVACETAIKTPFLRPQMDGLLGADYSQTWTAA